MLEFTLAIHGGAGTILKSQMSEEKETIYRSTLHKVLEHGKSVLEKGGSSIDAVEQSVILLEDSPLFNAGKGSVFTSEGINEMEASIMEGQQLMAGAVAAVKGVKNPVSLARKVMDKSEFLFLSGEGAAEFAREQNLAFEPDSYFFDQFRYDQLLSAKASGKAKLDHSAEKEKKFGTVGAVALDVYGNLAAATSTGGLTNKKYGRIGDSPIIGSGCYANNETCAVSCTGYGEFFLRGVAAYDVSALMEYKELSLKEAADYVIQEKMVELGGEGGLIAVDSHGNTTMPFNCEGMYRGFANSKGKIQVNIYK